MKNSPRRLNDRQASTFTTDWKIDDFLNELNKRSIEFSLALDSVTSVNSITFTIRHRTKDKRLMQSLLDAMLGTIKQG